MNNTIFAQASAPGKCGIAVFRVSGLNALNVLKQLCNLSHPLPRHLYLKDLYRPDTQELIDKGMAVYFPAPYSFTGEDVVELYMHGSIAVGRVLTECLLKIENVRMAEPGEFAKRAFLNRKMDLTAIEGLADLIEAETVMQHRQAMRQMNGELEKLYDSWRRQLIKIAGLLEAYIDFPDEGISNGVLNQAKELVEILSQEIYCHLNDNRRGERLRNGITLAIIGRPNVGKSSLINHLARRDIAIVSSHAGTTRDVLEANLDIGGYPIVLSDTAGIRGGTKDIVEEEGIRRAIKVAQNADIKLILCDVNNANALGADLLNLIDHNSIIIVNKIDLPNSSFPNKINGIQVVPISLLQKIGLKKLEDTIIIHAQRLVMPASTSPAISRARYRHNLELALVCLNNFDPNTDLVLAAEDIRIAIRYLSIITGKVEVDEILGEIFANFCIGK